MVAAARGRRASGSRRPVAAARRVSPPRALDQSPRWIAAKACRLMHDEGRGGDGQDHRGPGACDGRSDVSGRIILPSGSALAPYLLAERLPSRYTPWRMRFRRLPGFQDRLLVCSFGHDHTGYPVVGSFQDRSSGYGKQPLPSFHCPSCGMTKNPRTRPDNWRESPSINDAMDLGNILPCGLCFKDLRHFLLGIMRDRSQYPGSHLRPR